MLFFQDLHEKRKIFPSNINTPEPFPQRIISLVPSQTELLYHLGLDQRVVGITKFCTHPDEWFRSKKRVGGTKALDMAIIKELNPDLIIANKEENDKEQVLALSEHYPVWVSDVSDLRGALDMIFDIGALTGTVAKAATLATTIKESFNELLKKKKHTPLKAAYLIWRDPYMAAGGDTFIHDMMEACGLENVFAGLKRYPVISPSQLAQTPCGVFLFSSEPYPFREKHIDELKKILAQYTSINEKKATSLLVDGEMFSWYGSRLAHAPDYFQRLRNQLYEGRQPE